MPTEVVIEWVEWWFCFPASVVDAVEQGPGTIFWYNGYFCTGQWIDSSSIRVKTFCNYEEGQSLVAK